MFLRVCLLVLLLRGSFALKSVTITVPEVVKSGDTVTLACTYDLEEVALYTIKWYINDEEFYKFVPKESPPSRAFNTPYINVDISKSGPVEVTLRGIRKEASGVYKCEVSADAPLFQTEIKMAHMRVVDVPAGLPLLQIDPEKAEIGNRISAVCQSQGSDPPANISWYINTELVPDTHDDVRIFPTKHQVDARRADHLRSRSRVEIVANRSFFAKGSMEIRCEATIFSIWSGFAEGLVHEETPMLASVLLSTSSQTHEDDNFDFFGSSSDCSNAPPTLLLHAVHLLPLLLRR